VYIAKDVKRKERQIIKMAEKFVYMDNAASTKIYPETLECMYDVLKNNYGNPSTLYKAGRDAKKIIVSAREKIASLLNCKPNEIYFTSGGTEADNWAIKGAAYANQKKGRHIITTKFEHHAVTTTLDSLEKEGFSVTYLDVYENGIIRLDDLENAIQDDTILIAIMYVNNEIGTIQPIKEAAEIAKKHNIVFFTDAVQAVGHILIDLAELGVNMLAFSGHKFGAPKGIGALYIKSGTIVKNLIDGGGQERKKRGGTEATANIAALASALEVSVAYVKDGFTVDRIRKLRDRLVDSILTTIPETELNGDRDNRIYSNANISVKYIEGESLILLLDMAGIAASTGSACSTDSLDPSHVLLAIGLPHETAHGSLRLSLSFDTTDEDIDYVLEKLPPIVGKLREMSPLYNQ